MKSEMEKFFEEILSKACAVTKGDAPGRIADLIRETKAKSNVFDSKVAVVVRDGAHARYLRNELMRELDVLSGVDVMTARGMYLNYTREIISSSLHKRTVMALTLNELSKQNALPSHLAEVAKVHLVDTASSLVELITRLHSSAVKIGDLIPGLNNIYGKYAEKLGSFGYVEEEKILTAMKSPQYDLVIVDRPGDLDPLDISLLKGILDNSNRTMVLSPSLEKDTSDSLLGGKRLKFPVESSHVHMGEFPKSMDEIKEAVKLVKSLLSEENTPIDIGIAAPNDYLEVLSALLGESGIPSSYRFNVPVKGNPAHEAFELILKVSSETATLTDALALLKNPLVRIGDDSGQYVKMKHYFSAFIRRHGDAPMNRWRDRAESEDNRILHIEKKVVRKIEEENLALLKKYMEELDSTLEKMPKKGPISTLSEILLSNIKKCSMLQSIENHRAITDASDAVRTASRTYFNLEKLLLEMSLMDKRMAFAREDFLSLFRSEVSGKKRRVDSTYADGVLLMDHAQAELRGVKKIIVLGVGEDTFPLPNHGVPLLDRQTLSDLSLCDHRKRDLWAKTSLLSIMEGCDRIFLSHSTENGGTWSPVVEQYRTAIESGSPWERSDAVTGKTTLFERLGEVSASTDPSSFNIEGLKEAQTLGEVLQKRERSEGPYFGEIGDPREVLERTIMRSGIDNYVWSPTRFESYMKCPFRFLMENVFSIDQPDEFMDDVDAGTRGHIIHKILYKHLSEIDQVIEQEKAKGYFDEEGIRKKHIFKLSKNKVEALPIPPLQKEKMAAYLCGSKWNDRKMVQSFVDWEMSEAAEPVHLEASFGLKHHKMGGLCVNDHLEISKGDQVLKFHGRIDRIDKLGDYWNVVDYKTGGSGKIGNKKESIQLAIYHEGVEKVLAEKCEILSEQKTGGVLYSIVRSPSMSLKDLCRGQEGKGPTLPCRIKGDEKPLGTILARVVGKKTNKKRNTVSGLLAKVRLRKHYEDICNYLLVEELEDGVKAIEDFENEEGNTIRNIFMDYYAKKVAVQKAEIFSSIFEHHKRILDGDFKPDEKGGCSYCHLSKVCKVALGGGDE